MRVSIVPSSCASPKADVHLAQPHRDDTGLGHVLLPGREKPFGGSHGRHHAAALPDFGLDDSLGIVRAGDAA